MRELLLTIPNADDLVDLEPEELASILILLIKSRIKKERSGMLHVGTITSELRQDNPAIPGNYSHEKWQSVEGALIEALHWLEIQGLIVPAPGSNGQQGWRVLSRRAEGFTDPKHVASFAVARRFPKEALHPAMRERVWSAFIRGEYDVAVLQAIKSVEVAVRDASGLGPELFGVDLMRKAFSVAPKLGPLTDPSDPKGEQEARQHLFAGVVGGYKNPHSHRNVDLEDPQEASEIVMIANHLLRIVDRRRHS